MKALILILVLLACTGEAFALTVSWTCNPEPDMKEYRVESSKDAGASWGVEATWPHPKPCTSPISMEITRYMVPGERLFRVFAIDKAGNVATRPSQPASYTVKPSPIGNPGGQEETALPPSPYKEAPVTPPPPPAVPSLTGLKVSDIAQTTATVSHDLAAGFNADIRIGLSTDGWGSATSLPCTNGVCRATGLQPRTQYKVWGVWYGGVMNQGATYGLISDAVTFTTMGGIQPPPPSTEIFTDVTNSNGVLSFQFEVKKCPKGVQQQLSSTKNGKRTVTQICRK